MIVACSNQNNTQKQQHNNSKTQNNFSAANFQNPQHSTMKQIQQHCSNNQYQHLQQQLQLANSKKYINSNTIG
jgi:hypothetical protein